MGDMYLGMEFPGQNDIPDQHDLLRRGGNPLQSAGHTDGPLVHDPLLQELQILLMADEKGAEVLGVVEGVSHGEAAVPAGRHPKKPLLPPPVASRTR